MKEFEVKTLGQVLDEAWTAASPDWWKRLAAQQKRKAWAMECDAAAAQAVLEAAGVPQLLEAAREACWLIGDDDGEGWMERRCLRDAIARTEAACRAKE